MLYRAFCLLVMVYFFETSARCSQGQNLTTSTSGHISSFFDFFDGSDIVAANCTWSVKVSAGKFIRFRFVQLNLMSCRMCERCSSVSISNLKINDKDGQLKLCSFSAPNHPYTTTTNEAVVTFQVYPKEYDEDLQLGFNLTYEEVDQFEQPDDFTNCGGVPSLVDSSLRRGTIYSYATARGIYRPNENCRWIIKSRPFTRIRFTLAAMDVQDDCPCNVDLCLRDCQSDHITVWSGSTDESPSALLMRKCGIDTMSNCFFVSAFNEALVIFRTDERVQLSGFILEYEVAEADSMPCESSGIFQAVQQQIDGAKTPTGVIASYQRAKDGKCRNEDNCYWSFTNIHPSVFSFKFTHMDFRWSCHSWNQLKFLIDGVNVKDSWRYQDIIVGRTEYFFIARESKLEMHFRTMTVRQYQGFNMTYHAAPIADIETCSRKVIDGTKRSRGKVENHVRQMGAFRTGEDCVWIISAEPGQTITLTIEKLNIDPCGSSSHSDEPDKESSCDCNYLSIYDGIDPDTSPPLYNLTRICGFHAKNLSNNEFVTSGPYASIRFVTSNKVNADPLGDGFTLDYRISVSDEVYITETKVIALTAFFGFIVVGTMVASSITGYYQKKAAIIRKAMYQEVVDAVIGDRYIVPMPQLHGIMEAIGCEEYSEVIEQLSISPDQFSPENFGGNKKDCKTGFLKSESGCVIKVNAKRLGCGSSDQMADFLRQDLLIHMLNHENILQVCGIVLFLSEPHILFHYMENGNLRDFLSFRNEEQASGLNLIRFCKQICSGMAYLAHKNYIHGNLACSNIFLDGKLTPKISNFTFAYSKTDFTSWHAPEVKQNSSAATLKSDVWSYGAVCLEIFDCQRYPVDLPASEKCRPRQCPNELFEDVIEPCLSHDPEDRPTFEHLHKYFETASLNE